MSSILNQSRDDSLTPRYQRLVHQGELAAHLATLAIFDEVERRLPNPLKHKASRIFHIGLLSAYGRSLATVDDVQQTEEFLPHIADILRNEIHHWTGEDNA